MWFSFWHCVIVALLHTASSLSHFTWITRFWLCSYSWRRKKDQKPSWYCQPQHTNTLTMYATIKLRLYCTKFAHYSTYTSNQHRFGSQKIAIRLQPILHVIHSLHTFYRANQVKWHVSWLGWCMTLSFPFSKHPFQHCAVFFCLSWKFISTVFCVQNAFPM